jgi:hypothetical protein
MKVRIPKDAPPPLNCGPRRWMKYHKRAKLRPIVVRKPERYLNASARKAGR